jgi:hypothetical protein
VLFLASSDASYRTRSGNCGGRALELILTLALQHQMDKRLDDDAH